MINSSSSSIINSSTTRVSNNSNLLLSEDQDHIPLTPINTTIININNNNPCITKEEAVLLNSTLLTQVDPRTGEEEVVCQAVNREDRQPINNNSLEQPSLMASFYIYRKLSVLNSSVINKKYFEFLRLNHKIYYRTLKTVKVDR